MKTIIIIHRNKVLFRDENYMERNYTGNTLEERIIDLVDNNNYCGKKPTIIVQGKSVERIIKL